MKLNRRHVLVAATAFATGYGQLNQPAAAAKVRTPKIDQTFADGEIISATAAECAAACNECLDACTARLVSGTDGLVELLAVIRECGDICAVTATQLARKGTRAPALRQACADACSRMIAAARDFSEITTVQRCSTSAARCANACCCSIA